MAIITITEAAKLVRRGRATLYRDIEKGRLSKTVSASGETGVETSELVRAYGKLYIDETKSENIGVSAAEDIDTFGLKLDAWKDGKNVSKNKFETSGDNGNTAILVEKLASYEQRIALLERIASLEATVRKDTTTALKAQLADKDVLISVLKDRVLMLEYQRPDQAEQKKEKENAEKRTWWQKLIR